MNSFRAKRRGSLLIEGVTVPFDAGVNVTPLAEQVPAKVLENLVGDGIWEDITVAIKQAEVDMAEKLKKVEKARKVKVRK